MAQNTEEQQAAEKEARARLTAELQPVMEEVKSALQYLGLSVTERRWYFHGDQAFCELKIEEFNTKAHCHNNGGGVLLSGGNGSSYLEWGTYCAMSGGGSKLSTFQGDKLKGGAIHPGQPLLYSPKALEGLVDWIKLVQENEANLPTQPTGIRVQRLSTGPAEGALISSALGRYTSPPTP
jgi:hypothetical protein